MKTFWIKFIASLPLAPTTVLIADGKVVVKRGKIHSALVSALKQLAYSNEITIACIHATEIGNSGHKLSFFGIPDKLHQRFRNVWAANCR